MAERATEGDYLRVTFEVPPRLAPFLAPKGSISVDGVSLTVNGGSRALSFDVMLVPYTLDETTLGDMKPWQTHEPRGRHSREVRGEPDGQARRGRPGRLMICSFRWNLRRVRVMVAPI